MIQKLLITPKKLLAFILVIISIIGYGYVAFALFTPGETLDPVVSNPLGCTGPTDPNCIISQAWEQDLTNGYVFNDESNVGIGTNTPAYLLHIKKDFLTDNTNSQEMFLNVNQLEINPTEEITTSRLLYNNLDILEWNVDNQPYDADVQIGLNLGFTQIFGSHDINTIEVFKNNVSTGDIAGTQQGALGSGNIESLIINDAKLFHIGSGTIEQAIISRLNAELLGSGIINHFTGVSVELKGDPVLPKVNEATGVSINMEDIISGNTFAVDVRLRNVGGAAVSTAAFNVWGDSISAKPGISTTGQASVLQALGFPGAPAVSANTTVFGIYFNQDAFSSGSGSNSEYGLYIADGQNYLSNGVRIGGDNIMNQIDDSANGFSANQLYIGNATIDTTTPSDERTKTNITDTQYGLETLNQINIIDFIYDQSIMNDNNALHTGVLAQQVATLYPEAVSERTDGYLMVDYKTFIPLALRAIQELDVKIENIESSSTTIVSGGFSLGSLQEWLGDISNEITNIFAERFVARNEICINQTCVNESQLQQILQSSGYVHTSDSDDGDLSQSDNQSNDQDNQNNQDDQESEVINDIPQDQEIISEESLSDLPSEETVAEEPVEEISSSEIPHTDENTLSE